MFSLITTSPRTCIPVRWFGFDIRTTLSMVALEVMSYNQQVQTPRVPQPLPWQIWWHPHFTTTPFLDPFEAMLPSAVRSASNYQVADMARYFGLQPDPENSPSHQQAVFARDLIQRSGALAGLGATT